LLKKYNDVDDEFTFKDVLNKSYLSGSKTTAATTKTMPF